MPLAGDPRGKVDVVVANAGFTEKVALRDMLIDGGISNV